jgi:hypothetical protein
MGARIILKITAEQLAYFVPQKLIRSHLQCGVSFPVLYQCVFSTVLAAREHQAMFVYQYE